VTEEYNCNINMASSVVVDIPKRRLPNWILDGYLSEGLMNAVFKTQIAELLSDVTIFISQRFCWLYITLRIRKLGWAQRLKFGMKANNFVAIYDRNMAEIPTIGFNQWR